MSTVTQVIRRQVLPGSFDICPVTQVALTNGPITLRAGDTCEITTADFSINGLALRVFLECVTLDQVIASLWEMAQ
jgi:hypothetical protein